MIIRVVNTIKWLSTAEKGSTHLINEISIQTFHYRIFGIEGRQLKPKLEAFIHHLIEDFI